MGRRLHLRYAPRYDHATLVERAVKWLKGSKRCEVVHTTICVMNSEQPDAIGWKLNGGSVLVECKASREDFRRDSLKSHRKLLGMGNERWFLTSVGLVQADELPMGWGLLEAHPTVIRIIKSAARRWDSAKMEEIRLLVNWRREPVHELPTPGVGVP